jgi:hypothetical protein
VIQTRAIAFLRPLAVTGLLFAAALPLASAQSFSTVEERMSAAQFREAGLDKLSAEELAALNAWLQKNVGGASATAAPSAVQDRTGFGSDPSGGAGEVRSRLQGEFRGWQGKTVFALDNGQVWQQVGNDKWTGVKVENPTVLIEPAAFGSWRLKVEGYNTTTKVKRVR